MAAVPRAASPEHSAFFDTDAAGAAWALAPALAGRPAMRLARITRAGGKRRAVYDRGETPITEALPPGPAAVLLYDVPDRQTATTAVLAFDLDAKKTIDGSPAGAAGAAGDADLIAATVRQAGGSCIVSAGRTGGHHVWVPLAEPLTLQAAAALAHAMRRACPTLDPAPLGNAATGCLRPPGSPHAAGGFQVLLTPLHEAAACLAAPNPAAVLEALWRLAVPTPPQASAPQMSQAARETRLPETGRPLAAKWEQLAAAGPQHGQYGGDASLARWYLTMAAVRAGWSAEEWVAAISGWPWLSRQLADPRRLALARTEFEKAKAQWKAGQSVQKPDTSPQFLHGGGAGQGTITSLQQPQPPDVHQSLRQVRTWLQQQARCGRMSPALHAVARAVLFFAHAGKSHRIQVGVRALAIAAAVGRSTAAAALNALDELGFISRVGRGIGRGADVWEIDLGNGDGLPPARGTIWATRPVFRVVGGHGPAEVYEALSTADAPLSSRDLAGMLGRSPTTITGHLKELASWGLADGGGRAGWVVGPADPDELAARLGVRELVQAQITAYRAERAAWWAWLEAKGLDRHDRHTPGLGQVLLLYPPDAEQRHSAAARGDRAGPGLDAAIDLVREVLGGTLVSSG